MTPIVIIMTLLVVAAYVAFSWRRADRDFERLYDPTEFEYVEHDGRTYRRRL